MKVITNKLNTTKPITDLREPTIYNIIDLDETQTDIDLTFNVVSDCVINLSSCTFTKDKHIKVTINLTSSQIDVKLNVNSLTIGNLKTTIELYGTNTKKIKNTNIDMQVSGILASAHGAITCVPIYDFNTNLINATHGVTMGTFDEAQIFNLLTKGIALDDAKTMIIWSKFNTALMGVEESERELYYHMILDKWKQQPLR